MSMIRFVLAAALCAAAADWSRGSDPDREARVRAALAAACQPAVTAAPSDAERTRRVKVALALACPLPAPAAAEQTASVAAPCGCPGQCGCSPCRCAATAPKWQTDYAAAMREAARDGKPVLALVTSPATCPACRTLEAGTLKDAGVIADLAGYVAVKIDAAAEPELARKLGASVVPHLVVADAAGKIVSHHDGLISAAELRTKLRAGRPAEREAKSR